MKPTEILEEIQHHLQESRGADCIEKVILYGSRLHGEQDNDVDILCIMRPNTSWQARRAVRNLLGDIELKFDILFDVRYIESQELHTIQAKQPFVMSAFREGLSATITHNSASLHEESFV